MDKLTFYEQVGIVIPGSVLVTGLLFYFPEFHSIVAKEGMTLGQFGIFLLLSYAAGHLVAAVGNGLESAFWKLFGGMPSSWVAREGGNSLLSEEQVQLLGAKISHRLGITIPNVAGLDTKRWHPISRQIFADVNRSGKPQRIDTFNGNYGLNRGLCSAMILLGAVALVQGQRLAALGFLVVGLVYGYRAYRFGVHYARELYLQFLVLENSPSATKMNNSTPAS